MAEDVVARGDGLGDLDEPGEVVADEDVGGPEVGGGVDDGLAAYVEEFEFGFVDVLLSGGKVRRC